jgi:Domain of unknown function (DUF4145)
MNRFFAEGAANWAKQQPLPNRAFVCGYCGTSVSSITGYALNKHRDASGGMVGGLYICPNCGGPTFFHPAGTRSPMPSMGSPVPKVPADLTSLYEEARRCSSQGCFTAAVLLCRKMLMNLAVAHGAKEGLKFIEYVSYLSDAGYVPPNGKLWVDHIRKKGNEATHEIALMGETDARELIQFVEMLLRFAFEFPSMIPPPAPAP